MGFPPSLPRSRDRVSLHRGMKTHLVEDVVERVGAVDGKADEDQVRLGVREGSQTIVLFLASRVPEGKLDRLARWGVDGVGNVVFKDGRDVFL